MRTLGIVGGGQLGQMMSQAAKKLDIATIVLDPGQFPPAKEYASEHIQSSFDSKVGIQELAQKSDVLTFEIELAGNKALESLEKDGYPVHPSSETLARIKNKYEQKQFLKNHGIPLGEFSDITQTDDLYSIAKMYGYPFVVKAKRDSYDGRGNYTVESEKDFRILLEKFKGRELYAEKFVPFEKELAVMVARDSKGNIETYPTVETMHTRHICDVVYAPANVDANIAMNAQNIAKKVINAFEGQGVFGVEMFYLPSGEILLNEVAPRVHNSGHYTIEACETSQFEQHVRAVMGMSLGSTHMLCRAAVMKNILGSREGTTEALGLEKAKRVEGVSVHMYDKREVRIDRKMGHITAIGNSAEEAYARAVEAHSYISL